MMRDSRLPALLVWAFVSGLLLDPIPSQGRALASWGGDPPSARNKEGKKGAKSGQRSKKKRRKQGSGKKGPKKADMSAVEPDEQAEQTALGQLGEAFELKRTRHYSILHDTSEQDVKTFGIAIEKTYRSCVNYCLKLDFDARRPKRKLLIYYFEEHASYSDFSEELGKGPRRQDTPGVFFPDLNRSMFYNFRNQESFKRAREQAESQIEQLREQLRRARTPQERKNIQRQIAEARRQANRSNVVGGDMSEAIVQHEVSHQVLWNIRFHNAKNPRANPRWFVEGTAMMFEPISTGSSANFGAVNKDRLKSYERLESAGKLLPVRNLISSAGYFRAPQTAGVAYAQSWAMVHYLNRAKRKQLKKYAEAIMKQPKGFVPTQEKEIAAFEKAFGKLDRKWVARWKAWMKKVR